MTEIASLKLRVDSLEAKAATEDVRKLGKAANTTDDSFKRLRKSAAGVAIGAGIAFTLGAIVRNTIEAEKAQAQLAARIKSTGGAAGLTSIELQKMATGFMNVSTYSDEAIMESQALMLTFTKIGGEVFPRATQAAMDMSIALGTTLQGATMQLSKALNDPIKGIAALGRAGVQFSKDQREVIKSLVETGRTADAQKMILRELEKQMGGAARAARNTLGGAIENLKNQFGELLEGDTGGEGVRGSTAAINDLANLVGSGETRAAFASMVEGVVGLAGSFVTLAAEANKAWGDVQKWVNFNASEVFGFGGGDKNDIGQMQHDLGKLWGKAKEMQAGMDKTQKSGQKVSPFFEKRLAQTYREIEQLEKARKSYIQLFGTEKENSAAARAGRAGATAPAAGAAEADPTGGGGANKGATAAAKKAAQEAAAAAKARAQALQGLRESLATEEEAIQASYNERNKIIAETTAAGSADQIDLSRRSTELRDKELADLREQKGAELEEIRMSLRSQEEAITESYTRRMAIIEASAAGNEVLAQQLREKETARRDEDLAALAAAEQAKRDSVWQGLLTEEEMMVQYHERKREEILRATLDTETERQELLRREEERFMAESAARERDRIAMITGSAGDMFGALAGLMKTYAQGSSKESKRMFKIAQGFSIAQAIISIATGISKAQELGYPMNIFESIRVAAVGATQIAAIKGQQYSGAYDQGGMIQAGKYGMVGENGPEFVKGPAMVTGRELTARRGAGGGAPMAINTYVTVNSNGSTDARTESTGTTDQDAKMLANLVKQTVQQEMQVQQKAGGILWRMNNG